MRKVLRILCLVITSPLWVPVGLIVGCGAAVVFLVCAPVSLLEFAVTGQWKWPGDWGVL